MAAQTDLKFVLHADASNAVAEMKRATIAAKDFAKAYRSIPWRARAAFRAQQSTTISGDGKAYAKAINDAIRRGNIPKA